MKPGTKVIIEAIVEFHDTHIDKYAVKTKNGDHVYFVASDLTVCETAEPTPTPSFKAGQEVEVFTIKKNVKIIAATEGFVWGIIDGDSDPSTISVKNIRPIPAQPTVESELREIVEGVENCRYSAELAVEKILAWHQKYTRLSSELRNLLEDVVNELELSEGMIEKHGPLGTEPSKLVRLVLDQKDQQIKALKAGMIDIKHSGRLEVSVPSDEEIEKEAKEKASELFGTDSVLGNPEFISPFLQGVRWVRDNFMTRKEAGK